MVRKAVLFLSIISLLNFTAGCTSSSYVFIPREVISLASPDSVAAFNSKKIVEADLIDNRIILYDAAGAKYRERIGGQEGLLAGKDRDGSTIVVPFRDVGCVVVEKNAYDGGKTMLFAAVTGLLLICAVAVLGVRIDVSGNY